MSPLHVRVSPAIRRRALGCVAALLIVPGAAQSAVCAKGWKDVGGGVCERAFGYTGAVRRIAVPAGVVSIKAIVSGAAGGTSLEDEGVASRGGKGGRETATFAVVPGDHLRILVGQHGFDGVLAPTGTGGWPSGGHASSRYGGSGGGGSYVFGPHGLLVAAGGGGGGGHDYNPAWALTPTQENHGGAGSGAAQARDGKSVRFLGSGDPSVGSPGGGIGGSLAAGGIGGKPDLPSSWYGFGISTGETGWGPAVSPTILGKGGDSYPPVDAAGIGMAGGGGGGYYGGGGGGTIDSMTSGGGGGGGSGFVTPTASSSKSEIGVQPGNGRVVLRYVR